MKNKHNLHDGRYYAEISAVILKLTPKHFPEPSKMGYLKSQDASLLKDKL
ncbi:hypothetical protein [Candidatus Thiosymbion oneisti]|nr:hypothetical protein [Candidatus Thiosymbion oneisti]